MKSIIRARLRLPLLLVAALSSFATFSSTIAVFDAQHPAAAMSISA